LFAIARRELPDALPAAAYDTVERYLADTPLA
jgi:hypothetical protein